MSSIRLLLILAIVGCVVADKTITVDGGDMSIKYEGSNDTDIGATWTTVARSPDSCDTPQILTSRLGDTMTYTFTGTGIFVVGTTGVKRGKLNFNLDGTDTPFDRTGPSLMCDQVLFQKTGLPNQQHIVVATLVERGLNLQSGQQDGVLSIQRIRYTVPGSDSSSSSNVPAIAGAIGGVVVLAIAVGFAFFFYRKRKARKLRDQQRGRGYFDDEDVPNSHVGNGGGGKAEQVPAGLVATPFPWNGPDQPHQYQADEAPGSPSLAASQPLLQGFSPTRSSAAGLQSEYGASPPPGGARTHTSSGSRSDPRRDSAQTGTGTTYVTSNPDSSTNTRSTYPNEKGGNRMSYPMDPIAGGSGRGRNPEPTDDGLLVDRIAIRLADMLTERVGQASHDDMSGLPPYQGDDRSVEGHARPSGDPHVPVTPPPPRQGAGSSSPNDGVQSLAQQQAMSASSRFGPRPRPNVQHRTSLGAPPAQSPPYQGGGGASGWPGSS